MSIKNRIVVYSSRHYDALRSVFSDSLLHRFGIRKSWQDIDGWFTWRSAQEEAVNSFPDGSRFVEVGTYLGRSVCSLAEVVERSGKRIDVIGIDTCRGSGPEGSRGKDYHASAVQNGGGTFAGELHRNVIECGLGEKITLIISDSVSAARLFSDASLEWVHLDARHDYASVKADIEAWLPKVRRGGWLSGDDCDRERWPEVVKAVADALPGAKPWSNHEWRWVIE
jgi:methyltransferase family protein